MEESTLLHVSSLGSFAVHFLSNKQMNPSDPVTRSNGSSNEDGLKYIKKICLVERMIAGKCYSFYLQAWAGKANFQDGGLTLMGKY